MGHATKNVVKSSRNATHTNVTVENETKFVLEKTRAGYEIFLQDGWSGDFDEEGEYANGRLSNVYLDCHHLSLPSHLPARKLRQLVARLNASLSEHLTHLVSIAQAAQATYHRAAEAANSASVHTYVEEFLWKHPTKPANRTTRKPSQVSARATSASKPPKK